MEHTVDNNIFKQTFDYGIISYPETPQIVEIPQELLEEINYINWIHSQHMATIKQ